MTLADLIRGHSLFVVTNHLLRYCQDTMYTYPEVYRTLAKLRASPGHVG